MRIILIAQTHMTDLVPGYEPHDSFVDGADELAEQAGRLCYVSWHRPNPATSDNRGYLANIIQQGHFSVLEHASATFYIDGVTRNFTHELIRHRHLSFSEVSQRYVDVSEFPFVGHPAIDEVGGSQLNTVAGDLNNARQRYGNLVDDLVLRGGMDRKTARGAARSTMPSGLETRIVVTGNHRAWRDVLSKRLAPAADAEFRAVARELLRQLILIAPGTYQDFPEVYA